MGANPAFENLARHFWLAFVLVTIANIAVLFKSARARFEEDEKLFEDSKRLLYGFAFFGNVPWLLLGYGLETGRMSSVFEIFNGAGNPFVEMWVLVLAALLGLGTAWIFWGGGAGALARVASRFNPLSQKRISAGFGWVVLPGIWL